MYTYPRIIHIHRTPDDDVPASSRVPDCNTILDGIDSTMNAITALQNAIWHQPKKGKLVISRGVFEDLAGKEPETDHPLISINGMCNIIYIHICTHTDT